ncbi:HAD family phosphatase [Neolewinella lacunae]|uniref:HAD family phosphatase n=1 Tax=Neolewinella lacunae TaxID=1517758 RepID=A0A923T8M6_9BACT|nr:HAD family phosphatase [Neolewinella lacunae]MBC6994706.1 HAD family phosphatase [Neolewinella lacunae]MDN3634578.1 HAD family phosphatase [Neolewinella lacunae]
MARFLGLLCDLDGTLADTEPQHCSAWLNLLESSYGLHYDEHWFEQWIGTSDRTVADWLIREHGLSSSIDEMIAGKQEKFHAIVRTEGSSFPGVAAALAEISAAFPLAIATNSGRVDAGVVVPALGLDRFTDTVVTATDVVHLKPAPDIYLLAAQRLGLPAAACIAIEDSTPGGAAAKAAGCYLIGLNDKVIHADEWCTDNAAALRRALEMLREG